MLLIVDIWKNISNKEVLRKRVRKKTLNLRIKIENSTDDLQRLEDRENLDKEDDLAGNPR